MLFDNFDKIYLINLKRRPDRLEDFFMNNKEFINKNDIEVFEAIDGTNINDPEWKFSKGALGCWLSHIQLLQKIKKTSYKKVLILEDDAIVDNPNLLNNQQIVDFLLHKDWDMFYLGGYHHKPPTKISDDILKYNWALTTHAYAVNTSAIDTILEYSLTRKYWIDGIFAELHSILNVYGPSKDIMIQTQSVSDIETSQKSKLNKIVSFFKLSWIKKYE